MIDVMTRLKTHHMAEGGTPQAAIAERCGISQRSVERILTEAIPTVRRSSLTSAMARRAAAARDGSGPPCS